MAGEVDVVVTLSNLPAAHSHDYTEVIVNNIQTGLGIAENRIQVIPDFNENAQGPVQVHIQVLVEISVHELGTLASWLDESLKNAKVKIDATTI